jgi:hypothetical protein
MISTYTTASLPFAIFCISLLSSKFVHLYIHASGVSPLAFLFFSPTILISDLLTVFFVRLLLRREKGALGFLGFLVGCVLS